MSNTNIKQLLFVAHTNNLKGGGELSLVELIKGAAKRGYKCHVIVPGQGEFADKIAALGVGVTVIKYFYWGRDSSPVDHKTNLLAVKQITDVIKQNKINCVITNTLMIPWAALAAALTDVAHIWITREKLDQHRGHLRDNYDFINTYSNVIFANSKDNAKYLKNEIGLKKVKQFYSYVDPGVVQLGARFKKPRIINVSAQIQPSKDQLELIQALAELKQKKQLGARTVFIGAHVDDSYFKKINNLIKHYNLQEDVSFAGFHSQPFKLIGPNDIFVRTSKYESLGRTITEGMKLGLIVVAADIDSSVEAFELGGGSLYRSGHPKDLAKVLREIITDFNKHKKLAIEAQKRALINMSEKNCHDSFFRELTKIISQKNPHRELRHLLPEFVGLADTVINLETETKNNRELLRQYENELQSIKNSRGWKAVVKARKILGRQ